MFAAVLFEMYQRYAQKQGWKFEILDASENGIGGYKEASAKITGKDVFAKLKFESGRPPGTARACNGVAGTSAYVGCNR